MTCVEGRVATVSNPLLTAETTRVFKKSPKRILLHRGRRESSAAADIEYLRKRALSVHH